uniref:HECT domain-containing protein n=1 Tax=Steinernema glaseri TaxID=37863 RepID=A0A1I7Z390_9BILA
MVMQIEEFLCEVGPFVVCCSFPLELKVLDQDNTHFRGKKVSTWKWLEEDNAKDVFKNVIFESLKDDNLDFQNGNTFPNVK